MKHKFECNQCSKMYSSRQSRWRHIRNDHVHKQKFNVKSIQTGGDTTSDQRLQKILQNLSQIQGKTDGDAVSNKALEKILPLKESSVEEKGKDNKKVVKKLLQKMLESLDEESEVEEEKEKEIEFQEDIENKIFEDVTLEERKRFYRLLDELKSRKSHLENEDFQKIDMLLPQYFKKEYGMRANGMQRQKESFSDQINQELRKFQQKLPQISLEMQIILNFMDEKRRLIKELLNILKSDETDQLLKRLNVRGIITDEEYQDLEYDLSRDTMARLLTNRIFKSLNAENSIYG